jgi:hypothetical protein
MACGILAAANAGWFSQARRRAVPQMNQFYPFANNAATATFCGSLA